MEDIDDSSIPDYYFTLSSFLALSHDSHTSRQDIYSYFKYYPLELNYIGSKAYVVSALSEYREVNGKEVVSINGVSLQEIERKSALVFPHDNSTYLRLIMDKHLNNTSFLSFIDVAESEDDSVTLTFSDDSHIILSPLKSSEIDKGDLISASSSYSPYICNDYYRATVIEDGFLLISYNTCSENPDYPIKDFTRDLKRVLSDHKFSTIVLDLRKNGGGDSSILSPVIKLLKKQKCKKYCLIGENTFSSAILNAVSLKEDAGFTLVGSPTGGSINHYGELKSFVLPDTGWEVYYSTKYFKMSRKYNGSIIPDVLIEKDPISYFSGIDKEILYCLKKNN